MQIITFIAILFITISLTFLALSFFNEVKNGSNMTIARRIWLRMALVFAAVGSGLYFLHTFLR
jgi:hypothetical protein